MLCMIIGYTSVCMCEVCCCMSVWCNHVLHHAQSVVSAKHLLIISNLCYDQLINRGPARESVIVLSTTFERPFISCIYMMLRFVCLLDEPSLHLSAIYMVAYTAMHTHHTYTHHSFNACNIPQTSMQTIYENLHYIYSIPCLYS